MCWKKIKVYDSIKEAAEDNNILPSGINNVARKNGYHKTAGGFNWVYYDEYDSNKNYVVEYHK